MSVSPVSRKKLRLASFVSFVLLLGSISVASMNINTTTMFVVSVLMFVTCTFSAMHLFGVRSALRMAPLAVAIGFFAEYMGSNYGWFFGKYHFTDALGPTWFGVPVVIPMMWFGLSYICLVLANIILFRSPTAPAGIGNALASAFMCGMLVTAYDLGMDPYMVLVTKAWVMEKAGGWWFGETLQGFVGWMTIAFVVALAFNLLTQNKRARLAPSFGKIDALLPILIYANEMGFQIMYGNPVETRTISIFAMGIPLATALLSFKRWSWNHAEEAFG